MGVLQLLKIHYVALLDLLLKIHHLHNLLSIILHHVLLFQSLLLTLPLIFKIHHLHNLLSIILYYISFLLTIPLLKIHQLNNFLASLSTMCCCFNVSSAHYPSSSKSTTYTTS
jgi:hypothetical protein